MIIGYTILYSYSSEEKNQDLPPKLGTFAQLAVENARCCSNPQNIQKIM
jgi:hypothetical protein